MWEEGRVDAVLTHMHPDLEWLEPPESPDRTVVRGREAAMGALMLWLSTWASYENELRGITEHGNHVIVQFRQRMVGPSSGVPVEGDLFMVWTFEDALATRMAMYTSRAEADAEAGLGQRGSPSQ
jgi:ketosteroid isomerase-like protein